MDNEQAPLDKIPADSQPVKKSSSKMIMIGVVVIIAIGLVIFIAAAKSKTKELVNANNNSTINTMSPSIPPDSKNTTDVQLDKDTESINDNLNALDTDVKNVDQGLNDKPVDLSQ